MSSLTAGFSQYIKGHRLPIIISLIAVSLVIPPLPSSYPLYYFILAAIFLYSLSRANNNVNPYMILFYVSALLSIVISDPDPVFKSYGRLGLFVLLTGAVFPLFDSYAGDKLRFEICSSTIKICVLIGLISFVCFFLGINYMQIRWGDISENSAGVFAGITNQSMMLAPLCAIGTIYISTQLLYMKTMMYIKVAVVVCLVLTMFIAASRSAFLAAIFGVGMALIIRYWRQKSKVLKIVATILILGIASYPLYSRYASYLEQKQTVNKELGGTFASRDTKWDARLTEFKSSPLIGIGYGSVDWTLEPETRNADGVVEPGSTWLGVLSMTGILGFIPIFLLIFTTLQRLFEFSLIHKDFNSCVLFSIICAQIVHQFAEGYGLAAGSYLCYLFWLILGTGYSYPGIFNDLKLRHTVIENL